LVDGGPSVKRSERLEHLQWYNNNNNDQVKLSCVDQLLFNYG
jgi:hypothetical protein